MDRHLQYYRTKEKMKGWGVCVGCLLVWGFFPKMWQNWSGEKKKNHKTNQPANPYKSNSLLNFSLKIRLSLFVEQPQYKDFLGQPQDAYNSKITLLKHMEINFLMWKQILWLWIWSKKCLLLSPPSEQHTSNIHFDEILYFSVDLVIQLCYIIQ